MANRLELPSESKGVQVRKKACWNDGRTIDDAEFFTFGYSGRTTKEILDVVKQAGVSTIIDIRFTPLSRYKPDFSKRNLQRIIESHGLTYLHMPWLGVPREIRAEAAQAGDLNIIWQWYDDRVVNRFLGQGRNLHAFLNMGHHPVALMCVEFDPEACHRHRLFQALEDRGLQGFDL